jgi:hypothetical protein
MNENAKDHTSHVLENPPPYPRFVHPSSIAPTANAILDLKLAIIAMTNMKAPPHAKVTEDNPVASEADNSNFLIEAAPGNVAKAGKVIPARQLILLIASEADDSSFLIEAAPGNVFNTGIAI